MTIPTTVSVDPTDSRPADAPAPVKAWRPPMGWNSWDSYGTTITEQEVLDNARFMAEHLKDAGWDTLVIDAGWFDPNAHAHMAIPTARRCASMHMAGRFPTSNVSRVRQTAKDSARSPTRCTGSVSNSACT